MGTSLPPVLLALPMTLGLLGIGAMPLVACGGASSATRTAPVDQLEAAATGHRRAARLSPLEEALIEDLQDGRFDSFSLGEAGLIVSGARTQGELDRHRITLEALHAEVLGEVRHARITDPRDQAQRIFEALHRRALGTYARAQSSVIQTLATGSYNCVTATLLYNDLLAAAGIDNAVMESRTHVWSLVDVGPRTLEVETTNPKGFAPFRTEEEYLAFLRSRGLLAGVTTVRDGRLELDRGLLERKGSSHRRVSNRQLLSYIASNEASVAADEGRLEASFEHFARASALAPSDSVHRLNRDALLHNLALGHMRDGDIARGMQLLFVAAETGTLDGGGRSLMAWGFSVLGRESAARRDVRELERIYARAKVWLPGDDRILNAEAAQVQSVAIELSAAGRSLDAAELLIRTAEGSPERDNLRHTAAVLAVQRARVVREEDASAALELLARTEAALHDRGELSGMLHHEVGMTHFLQDAFGPAARSFREARRLHWDPEGATTANLFASLVNAAARASQRRDCDEALLLANEASLLHPADESVRRIRAACSQGDHR